MSPKAVLHKANQYKPLAGVGAGGSRDISSIVIGMFVSAGAPRKKNLQINIDKKEQRRSRMETSIAEGQVKIYHQSLQLFLNSAVQEEQEKAEGDNTKATQWVRDKCR